MSRDQNWWPIDFNLLHLFRSSCQLFHSWSSERVQRWSPPHQRPMFCHQSEIKPGLPLHYCEHPLQSNSSNAPMLQSHTIATVLEWLASVQFNALLYIYNAMQRNARLSGSSLPPPALMQCQARADWPGRPSMIILTMGRAKSTNLLHTTHTQVIWCTAVIWRSSGSWWSAIWCLKISSYH